MPKPPSGILSVRLLREENGRKVRKRGMGTEKREVIENK